MICIRLVFCIKFIGIRNKNVIFHKRELDWHEVFLPRINFHDPIPKHKTCQYNMGVQSIVFQFTFCTLLNFNLQKSHILCGSCFITNLRSKVNNAFSKWNKKKCIFRKHREHHSVAGVPCARRYEFAPPGAKNLIFKWIRLTECSILMNILNLGAL